jgi:hypothetical protein
MLNIFSFKDITIGVNKGNNIPISNAFVKVVNKTNNSIIKSGTTNANGFLLLPLKDFNSLNNLSIVVSVSGYLDSEVDINPKMTPQVYFVKMSLQENTPPPKIVTDNKKNEKSNLTIKPKFGIDKVKTGYFLAGAALLAGIVIYFTKK